MRKRCTKGKSCGATCIDGSERCVLELGPAVSDSLTKVRSRLGVVKLYEQARQQKVKGFQGKFNQIRGDLKKEIGGQVRKTADVAELKKRLQEAGLIPQSQKKEDIQDIFKGLFAKGQEEKAPSVPSAMKRELAALGGQQPIVLPPRQLDRSPGARTRTAPEVRRELAGIVESAKKGSMDLMMDDISRIMRGSLPQNIEIASDRGELGVKGRFKGSATVPGATTGNTRWARDDASDFDKAFKIYKRVRGDMDKENWDESVANGKKIGEGSYGTVLTAGGNKVHKRGAIGEFEADILKKVGAADLGPRLLVAELAAPKNEQYGIKISDGRIAMTKVEGKPIGSAKADAQFAGKNAADIYWKTMADLHRMGIAHNDAHIDNILIDKNGKGRWVDMGLAQMSPKAALAEAMGIFDTLKGAPATRVAGAYGQGNWQARRWDGTGVKAAERAKQGGTKTWTAFMERFPVASRVWENRPAAQYALIKMGLSKNDVSSIIDHGIRSTPESYTKGPWAKLTDKQALEILNILYDGI